MHGQGKALSPVGTAPALAEKTTSVELAGKAEKATATKLEVLEHGTYHKAGPRHDTPPQGEARHEVETPLREGKGELHVLPQTRGAAATGRARSRRASARVPERGQM